jgi:hypothetical protein
MNGKERERKGTMTYGKVVRVVLGRQRGEGGIAFSGITPHVWVEVQKFSV